MFSLLIPESLFSSEEALNLKNFTVTLVVWHLFAGSYTLVSFPCTIRDSFFRLIRQIIRKNRILNKNKRAIQMLSKIRDNYFLTLFFSRPVLRTGYSGQNKDNKNRLVNTSSNKWSNLMTPLRTPCKIVMIKALFQNQRISFMIFNQHQFVACIIDLNSFDTL